MRCGLQVDWNTICRETNASAACYGYLAAQLTNNIQATAQDKAAQLRLAVRDGWKQYRSKGKLQEPVSHPTRVTQQGRLQCYKCKALLNVEQQCCRISCTSCGAKVTIEKGDFAKGWCFEHEICAMKTENSFGASRKPEQTRVDCRRCKKKFTTQGVTKWQEYWHKLIAQADS